MTDNVSEQDAARKEMEGIAAIIADYRSAATTLDMQRQQVVKRVRAAMSRELPWLQTQLPAGYTLDAKAIDVHAEPHEDPQHRQPREPYVNSVVPADFCVSFRLLYNGKPLSFDMDLGTPQHAAEPACADLARRYGLAGVHVMGEPIFM